jgi:hypothetical protein
VAKANKLKKKDMRPHIEHLFRSGGNNNSIARALTKAGFSFSRDDLDRAIKDLRVERNQPQRVKVKQPGGK